VDTRAFAYITPYWRRLAGVMALSLVSTAASLYIPYLTRSLVDDALVGRQWPTLVRTMAWFAALGVLGFVLNVVSGLWYTRISAEILFDMRRGLYEHLQRLSPRFYARTRLGEIVSRINNDIGEIQQVAAESALAWVGNVIFLAGGVAILIWMDWRLFLAGMAPLPLAVWALMAYRRRIEGATAELRQRSADLGSFLIETLSGMRTVVTSGAATREVARFGRLNDAFIHTLMGVQRVHYLSGGLPALLIGAATGIVFLYGGWRVVQNTMTLGTLAAFMAYQARVVAPVQALMGLYGALATARVSWRRVAELLDTEPEVQERRDAIALPEVRGEIVFEDVSVSHGRGGAVLDRVNLRVSPGEVLAVVGASGSGKSTIADLILRLIDPDAGVVRLDGHDLRGVRLADLRRHVRVVEQDAVLLHTTLDENVRYARPEADEETMTAAIAAAGLAPFIATLPEGRRTIVGDRGLALSAGERQRIALARALVARPAVLVLDEPSAALDPEREREIVAAYRRWMIHGTTVVISHRFEVVRAADHVIVIDGARVVDAGTPQELSGRDGRFRELFAGDARVPS
jgi:ATP-binding cassette subfamily B protein